MYNSRLKIIRDFDYGYRLMDSKNNEVGIIDAVHIKDYLRITAFCVAADYRGSEHRYGKQLLECVVQEAQKDRNIKYILTDPKPEERYDEIEPMSLSRLYEKYLNLGFEFKDKEKLKLYENELVLYFAQFHC